jgi:hypothetical protein
MPSGRRSPRRLAARSDLLLLAASRCNQPPATSRRHQPFLRLRPPSCTESTVPSPWPHHLPLRHHHRNQERKALIPNVGAASRGASLFFSYLSNSQSHLCLSHNTGSHTHTQPRKKHTQLCQELFLLGHTIGYIVAAALTAAFLITQRSIYIQDG